MTSEGFILPASTLATIHHLCFKHHFTSQMGVKFIRGCVPEPCPQCWTRSCVLCLGPWILKKNLAQLMTSHDISWHLMTSYDPLSLWPFVPLLRVQSWGACFKPSWQPNSSPSQAWCPFDWIALATWGSQGTPDTTPNSESMWKQSDFAQDRFEKGTSKKAGPELGHSKLNYKVVSISIIVLCSH